ncbi:hypothetical protein R4Z10_18310 [Niallia sp. XMNu-256]|uniref:hypothetical protein n=1 Tax=Niallia sp. XMNu-256 TaxID=3082444 RepID=UPI0030D4CF31
MYYYPSPYPVYPYYQQTVPYYDQRQFPPVDTEQLEKSVQRFQGLIKQTDLLINRMANDKQFATELMSAAQESKKDRVNQLIRSTGVTIKIETTFTPTGIRIVLDNSKFAGDCCQLLIALRW